MAKNVVITGATSGIGEAIARAYLEKGENIVLTGRRKERLELSKLSSQKPFQIKSLDLSVRCYRYEHGKNCLFRNFRDCRSG